MEKKGEILNQLAIIADLLEKANIDPSFITVTFNLTDKDFNDIFAKIAQKNGLTSRITEDEVFMLKIGEVDFLFNKNNV